MKSASFSDAIPSSLADQRLNWHSKVLPRPGSLLMIKRAS